MSPLVKFPNKLLLIIIMTVMLMMMVIEISFSYSGNAFPHMTLMVVLKSTNCKLFLAQNKENYVWLIGVSSKNITIG